MSERVTDGEGACGRPHGVLSTPHRAWCRDRHPLMAGRKGCASFGGFGATAFHEAPPGRRRRMHFIGDSDTVGFCCDGRPGGGDDKMDKTENSYEA